MKINIFDIDNWKEIGATLARNKTRTFLTGFGIFWGTAMLAMLLGGSQGAKDMLLRNFSGFATNSAGMFATNTRVPYRGNPKGRWWSMDVTDVKRIREAFPELETVTEQYNAGNCSMRNGKYTYSGTVGGAAPEWVNVMTPKMYAGRFINEADMQKERKVAVVGKNIVNQLYPGDPEPLGKTIQVNNISYYIVGVAGQTSEINMNSRVDETVYIPASTFRRAFKRGDTVDLVMIVAKKGVKISGLIDKIRRMVYVRHYISPQDKNALWVFDISEEFEKVDNLFIGVSLLALFIGVSTLMAGIIGIGNIMWVIVKERTQEIGIRRAIGAKPADIITQILSEGMMLASIAGVAGITFAALVLGVAEHITANEAGTPGFQMTFSQAVTIVVTFLVLGMAAGLIPAIKAMKIKPIEALNDK